MSQQIAFNPSRPTEADIARFWRWVDVTVDCCWTYTGSKYPQGYGMFWLNPNKVRAHRVAWYLAGNTIPEGYEIDHLCRVRACVRPDHLELVTHRENLLRGPIAKARARTNCPAGHPFDEANTSYVRGYRRCRACARTWASAYYHTVVKASR